MTTAETTSTFENKFIEVVELLLKQQLAADARSESADHLQMDFLENIQTQLQALTRCVEAISTAGIDVPPRGTVTTYVPTVPKPSPKTSAPAPVDTLSEWERQKQLLLQGLDDHLEHETSEAGQRTANEAPEANASSTKTNVTETNVREHTSHDWIEHLDPNDAALSDDGERRDLVARLRKLEVELSLERATMARDRADLDAQLNELKRAERQQGIDQAHEVDGKNKEQGTMNRMLRFLGRKSP